MTTLDDTLIESCKNNDIETIKQNINDNTINELLINTACYGHLDTVKYLVKYFINEEKQELIDYYDVFIASLKSQNFDCVKYIVITLNIHNITLETILSNCENKIIIAWLVNELSIDVHENNEKYFMDICESDDVEDLKTFLNFCDEIKSPVDVHINNDDVFYNICSKNKLNILKYLLEYCDSKNDPIDIHRNNDSILLYVAEKYNFTILEYLINYANSINKPYLEINKIISYVCYKGTVDFLKFILQYSLKIGKPIDIHANSEELFRCACITSNLPIMKYLLEYANLIGTPINIHVWHEDPFKSLCSNGTVESVKFLLDYADSIKSPINIHHNCEEVFLLVSCYSIPSIPNDMKTQYAQDRFKIIKYLIEYAKSINSPININGDNFHVFKYICHVKQMEYLKCFISINDNLNRYIDDYIDIATKQKFTEGLAYLNEQKSKLPSKTLLQSWIGWY